MNIKVLKLRSGEEIACQVLEQDENNYKIFQPMVFKTQSSFDTDGRPYDYTTLSDWLINSDSKNVVLPSNHIAFVTEPNDYSLKLYSLESEREFSSVQENVVVDINDDIVLEELINNSEETEPETSHEDLDMFGMFLESLAEQTGGFGVDPSEHKRSKSDKNKRDRHMILMQFYIPAEAIMNLLTSGMLDPKVLRRMIKDVKKKNKFTGDETDREDFGNKSSDWNPDPQSDDYS